MLHNIWSYFLCAKLNLLNIKWKKCITFFLCTAATSLSIVSNFTSVFFSSFLFSSPQIQISKFTKCMYEGCCNRIFFASLLDSLFSFSHKISFQKTIVQNRAAWLQHVFCKKTQTSRKRLNKAKRKSFSPLPGIEPGSPAWQAGILTTILQRLWCCKPLHVSILPSIVPLTNPCLKGCAWFIYI